MNEVQTVIQTEKINPPHAQGFLFNAALQLGQQKQLLENNTPPAKDSKIPDSSPEKDFSEENAIRIAKERKQLARTINDPFADMADRRHDAARYRNIIGNVCASSPYSEFEKCLQDTTAKDGIEIAPRDEAEVGFEGRANKLEAPNEAAIDYGTLIRHFQQKDYPRKALRKELATYVKTDPYGPSDTSPETHQQITENYTRIFYCYLFTLADVCDNELMPNLKFRMMEEAKKDGVDITIDAIVINLKILMELPDGTRQFTKNLLPPR